MIEIKVLPETGQFAENKDAAAKIREKKILPAVKRGKMVTIDFAGIEYATQSFIHAMLAQAIREDPGALDLIVFTGCSDAVKGVIEIVVDYAQEV